MRGRTAGTGGRLGSTIRPPQKFGHGSKFTGQLLSRKQVSQINQAEPPPPPLRERGWGFNLNFGKTRFGDWGLEKSPTHRGNFWRRFGVSTPFALRATATPIIRRRLQLNLIKHPPTQKVTYLVDNHLLGIPI